MFQRLGSIPWSGWSGGRARSEGGSYRGKGRGSCGVLQIFAARECGSEAAAVVGDELTAGLQSEVGQDWLLLEIIKMMNRGETQSNRTVILHS